MMAWRIFRWRRRDPVASAGRHTRPLIGASVPGAAGTLVSSAARWDTGIDPDLPGADDEPVQLPAPAAGPVAAAAHVPESPPPATLAPPARSSTAQLPEPAPVAVGVSLGFSDGAQVMLEADDPRVRTFRAAAAALLEAPRA